MEGQRAPLEPKRCSRRCRGRIEVWVRRVDMTKEATTVEVGSDRNQWDWRRSSFLTDETKKSRPVSSCWDKVELPYPRFPFVQQEPPVECVWMIFNRLVYRRHVCEHLRPPPRSVANQRKGLVAEKRTMGEREFCDTAS